MSTSSSSNGAPRGCLLSFLPSSPAPKRIGSALPKLDLTSIHPTDRPALLAAQRSAEAADAAFARPGVPDVVVVDLADKLGSMVGVLHRLGRELRDARQFLVANDPDQLARERTDLEMRRLGASAAEILALRSATEALAARARLADQVRADVATLEARLVAAGHDLKAFAARVTASTSGEDLAHELSAYTRSAELVLEAYEQTRKEMTRR
jgi:hypothetical protein